jgi:repressor LexA
MDVDQLKALMAAGGETQADLARLLNVSPDKISKTLKGKRQLKLEEANKLAAYYGTARNESEPSTLLPIVGLVSAGAWAEGFEHIRGYMPSPDKSLSRDAFVVIVEGDSMDLIAQPGDGIIVDPHDRELLAGRFYIIRNGDGETTFKRYMENPARLEPCSTNPNHPIIYPGQVEFTVVGRARKRVADL